MVIGAGAHGQNVFEPQGGLAFVQIGDRLYVGEKAQDLLVHSLELAPAYRDSDQGRSEALGDGLQGVQSIGLPVVEILLKYQAAVTDD